MYINHNNITINAFYKFCKNAKEILDKYDIKTDAQLGDFMRNENNFKNEYGYSHPFFVVEKNNEIFTVDELIYPTIKLLNLFGFKTKFSCQGSNSPKGEEGYISFDESLTLEDRQTLYSLPFYMMKLGLIVYVDEGWMNPNERPIIRFRFSNVAGRYPRQFYEDSQGNRDKLTNILVYDATTLFLSELKNNADEKQLNNALTHLKLFQHENR